VSMLVNAVAVVVHFPIVSPITAVAPLRSRPPVAVGSDLDEIVVSAIGIDGVAPVALAEGLGVTLRTRWNLMKTGRIRVIKIEN